MERGGGGGGGGVRNQRNHQSDISLIRKELSQYAKKKNKTTTNSDIPKVSSRWSKFMTSSDGEVEEGEEEEESSHLLRTQSTVAQFALLSERKEQVGDRAF